VKFVELTKKEFEEFSLRVPSAHFTQSVEFGKLRKNLGWRVELLGVKIKSEIKLAGIVGWRKNEGDIYLGPLFDPKDEEILPFFARELKKRAKKRHVAYVTMSPLIVYQNLEQTGELIGKKNDRIIKAFCRAGFKRGYDVTPKFMFKKDISTFKTDDEMFKSFKTRGRTNIRNAGRNHLQIRTLSKEEMPVFNGIMKKTADRQGFNDKTENYYENFYDIFTKSENYSAEFVVVEFVVTKSVINELEQSYRKRINKLQELLAKTDKNTVEYRNQIKNIERRREMTREITSNKQNVPISVGLYVKSKREMIYLFGGNDPKYLGFCGTHAHAWKKMQEARRDGIPIFNFYGVSGIFDKHDKRYGVLEYKQGFNGYIEELIGGFYLVVSPLKYFFVKLLRRIKKLTG
jgi:alanine adding enzyme